MSSSESSLSVVVEISGIQEFFRLPTAFSGAADTALTIPVILSLFEAPRATGAIAGMPRKRMIAGWNYI
jgi:hypothetical protein